MTGTCQDAMFPANKRPSKTSLSSTDRSRTRDVRLLKPFFNDHVVEPLYAIEGC